MAFLQKPARWIQMLARNTQSFSAAPNFAFELAARRTSDDDMAGLDLGNVLGIISGSERIHAATIRRFTERFSRFNIADSALLPSYGLAEATLYVTSAPARKPETVWFDYEKLSAGHAKRGGSDGGVELVCYGAPRQGWRDLGTRGERRSRLLAQPAGVRAHLPRPAGGAVAGHPAGTVAAHRGPGRDVRR
jgi:long chain fatty acid CoA FadD26